MRYTGLSRRPTPTPTPLLKPNRRLKKKKLQAEDEGTVGLRRSLRLKLLGEDKKHTTPPKRKVFNWRNATLEQIAEFVLRDYNKKHGTDLEYLRILPGKFQKFWGFGYRSDFAYIPGNWMHFNFEARRLHADPSHKPLVLFAELRRYRIKYHLITLSLVKPTDEVFGCNHCLTNISHPGHGFRAGFNTSEASEPTILSEQDAAKLSKFALEYYNKKHGTNIKFERALKCSSFTCTGLLMDLDEKNRNWVHMNFKARMVVGGSIKKVLRMFAELYLDDDGKYVVATLLPAEPVLLAPELAGDGKWKKKYVGVNGCVFCPAFIRHPWHAYRFAFNDEPVIPRESDFLWRQDCNY